MLLYFDRSRFQMLLYLDRSKFQVLLFSIDPDSRGSCLSIDPDSRCSCFSIDPESRCSCFFDRSKVKMVLFFDRSKVEMLLFYQSIHSLNKIAIRHVDGTRLQTHMANFNSEEFESCACIGDQSAQVHATCEFWVCILNYSSCVQVVPLWKHSLHPRNVINFRTRLGSDRDFTWANHREVEHQNVVVCILHFFSLVMGLLTDIRPTKSVHCLSKAHSFKNDNQQLNLV